MVIIQLIVQFHLPGCCSLKEKRQRLSGLRQRFGKHPSTAVTESNYQDHLTRSEWTFTIAGNSASSVDPVYSQIENYLHEAIDGYVVNIERHTLQ